MVYPKAFFLPLFLLAIGLELNAQNPSRCDFKGRYAYSSGEPARTIKRDGQEIHIQALIYQESELILKSWGRAELTQRFSTSETPFILKKRWKTHGDTLFLRHKAADLPTDTLFLNASGNLEDRYGKVRFYKQTK